jgi:hypothetical protein
MIMITSRGDRFRNSSKVESLNSGIPAFSNTACGCSRLTIASISANVFAASER